MTGLFASSTVTTSGAISGAICALIVPCSLCVAACEYRRLRKVKKRVKKAEEQVEHLKQKRA